jgi:4-amino-4-deoxy-L-arabinose transferase-like glycosyltransferase
MQMTQALKKIPLTTFLFGIVLLGYVFFAVSHLGSFVTADEGRWTYERVPQYFDAWRSLDLEETFINDKPGVTLALVNPVAMMLYPDAENHCVEGKDKIINCDTTQSESLYQTFRIPLILVNGLLLIFLFFVIGRITNPWIALWSSILIGLSPPLIGISQIVNPDALLWSLASASLFSYLWYLKTGLKRAVVATGVFLGFALLSKYVALILIPFYLGVIILRFLILGDDELTTPRETLLRDLKMLALSVVLALVILLAFLPALLLDTDRIGDFLATVEGKSILFGIGSLPLLAFLVDTHILKSKGLLVVRGLCQRFQDFFSLLPVVMFGLFVLVILARLAFPEWSIFTVVRFDQKELTNAFDILGRQLSWYEAVLLNMTPVVYALTPVTLIGLLGLALQMHKKKLSSYYFFAMTISIFVILYEAILLYTNVLATIRYSVILYPLLGFLGSLGFWHLSRRLPLKHKELWLTFIIFGASLISIYSIKPFYFNYTNFLLPKNHIVTDAWGYGGYEGAQYLNSLPDAQNLTVWADYYGVCEFFVGKCLTAYNFDRETVQPDYYVLTRRGRIRYWSRYPMWERNSGLVAYQYYDRPDPAWELVIGGNPQNYTRVFKVQK